MQGFRLQPRNFWPFCEVAEPREALRDAQVDEAGAGGREAAEPRVQAGHLPRLSLPTVAVGPV